MNPTRVIPLCLMLALPCCSPEARPPEVAPVTPPAPASVPAAAPASSSAATQAPAVANGRVSARATERSPSPESLVYERVKVVFTNPSSRACTFTSYTLRWGSASKTFPLTDVTVPPASTRERWARVNANDDGYATITKVEPASMRVEVKSDCPTEP